MKNYIGLYIIILLLFTLVLYTFIFVHEVKTNLVEDAKILSSIDMIDDNTEMLFDKIENNFFEMEYKITSFVNHSVYKDVVKELNDIKYDIEFNLLSDFKKDTASLLKFLEEIVDNEKPKINNIFWLKCINVQFV